MFANHIAIAHSFPSASASATCVRAIVFATLAGGAASAHMRAQSTTPWIMLPSKKLKAPRPTRTS
jgi:hypothetical protein